MIKRRRRNYRKSNRLFQPLIASTNSKFTTIFRNKRRMDLIYRNNVRIANFMFLMS